MSSALAARFKRHGLLPSTRQKYNEILASANRDDLISWIQGKVHARTPIGTVLPMRAAVKHYLVAELGYDEDELKNLLPKAKGRSSKTRKALSPRQLAIYHSVVEEVDNPTIYTILALLPSTGLRIGEVTSLHVNDISRHHSRLCLVFRGKRDKERIVPLTKTGHEILSRFMEATRPQGWIFPSFTGRPITPHAVRRHTRRIAKDWPDLEGLTPHILRHTFATLAIRRGMNLKNLQSLMGHENIQTTSRYLHPSVEDLQGAIDKLGD